MSLQDILNRLTTDSCDEHVDRMRSAVSHLFLRHSMEKIKVHRSNVQQEYEQHKRRFESIMEN